MLKKIYSKFHRVTNNQLYFAELDGIRFLGLIMVIFCHTHGFFTKKFPYKFADDPHNYDFVNQLILNGHIALPMFFMLSGFILCVPFAHQYINGGKKIGVKEYFIRRFIRLEPPYIAILVILFMVELVTHMHTLSFLFPSFVASLFYVHNIALHHTPYITVVAWSLEVEIQYYIMAPILFKVLILPKVTRRLIIIAATIAVIFIQCNTIVYTVSIYQYAQYFMMGILMADFYVTDFAGKTFQQLWVIPVSIACWVGISYLPKYTVDKNYADIYASLTLPLIIAFFLYSIMKNDRIKKVFCWKFVPTVGAMCYSIYLLHYPIISFLGKYLMRIKITDYYLPNLFFQLVVTFVAIIPVCAVFYYYLEKPFMSRKWLDKIMKKDKHLAPINEVNVGGPVQGDGGKKF
jgi:peptidoglycan/LPS O-acetylase OafA/YrhL